MRGEWGAGGGRLKGSKGGDEEGRTVREKDIREEGKGGG